MCDAEVAHDWAQRALIKSYQLARQAGYRPGSPAMHALARAEVHHARTRRRWRDLQVQLYTPGR